MIYLFFQGIDIHLNPFNQLSYTYIAKHGPDIIDIIIILIIKKTFKKERNITTSITKIICIDEIVLIFKHSKYIYINSNIFSIERYKERYIVYEYVNIDGIRRIDNKEVE